jgi:hypothetical protein
LVFDGIMEQRRNGHILVAAGFKDVVQTMRREVDVVERQPTIVTVAQVEQHGMAVFKTQAAVQGCRARVVEGSADFSFALRAERAGEGPGRTYRVTYSATDASGRTASGSAVAVAPIAREKGPHGTSGGVPAGPDADDPAVPKPGAGPGRN